MNYILMHKNVSVAELEITEDGQIASVLEVFHREHAPIGVNLKQLRSLASWWEGRSIPASRKGLSQMLLECNLPSAHFLSLKSFGLSLSDQYWIKPVGAEMQWENINFFVHEFSRDIGEAFFNPSFNRDNLNLFSPDNTSDGWLKKKWIIKNGQRILVKAGSGPYYQEPFNEVIATHIGEALGLKMVHYELYLDEQQGYCCECANFIDTSTELVPAYALLKSDQNKKEMPLYERLVKAVENYGILGARQLIDDVLILDYILAGTDRHFGNFGFIRNADTLEFVGTAPIFDSGTSLWHDCADKKIGTAVKAMPFKTSQEEQLKLVSDWSRYDFGALHDIDKEIKSILMFNDNITVEHISAIAEAVVERIFVLKVWKHIAAGIVDTAFEKELLKLRYDLEPVYVYYRDKIIGKVKYNPELDRELAQELFKAGYAQETVIAILMFSPNIKSVRMAEECLK